MARVAIVYYSSTGNILTLARAIAEGAESTGAEVRLRRVEETAPDEAIDKNPKWREHLEGQRRDVEVVTLDDINWADAYLFGTPSRYGNPAAQLKAFIDTMSPLWQPKKLVDKVASGFTSSTTFSGGQESTLLALYTVFMHWGAVLVPPGYADDTLFAMGNPYGTSHWDQLGKAGPSEETLAGARQQGVRVASVADRLNGPPGA